MELADFIRCADNLIDGLTPRIERDQSAFVRRAANAGEWTEAIDNLISTLIRDHVHVTTDETSELLDLLSYLTWPATKLTGLHVITSPTED
jgi:hypothetical protein